MATDGTAALNPRLMRAVWESTQSSSVTPTGIQQTTLQVTPHEVLVMYKRPSQIVVK